MQQILVPTCAFCDKSLCLEEGVTTHYKIEQRFTAETIDENTGLREPIPTLKRETEANICPDCFDIYVAHTAELMKKFPPKILKTAQPGVSKDSVPKIQGIDRDPKVASKNFKVLDGTRYPDKGERIAPPTDDQVKPVEIVEVEKSV